MFTIYLNVVYETDMMKLNVSLTVHHELTVH